MHLLRAWCTFYLQQLLLCCALCASTLQPVLLVWEHCRVSQGCCDVRVLATVGRAVTLSEAAQLLLSLRSQLHPFLLLPSLSLK